MNIKTIYLVSAIIFTSNATVRANGMEKVYTNLWQTYSAMDLKPPVLEVRSSTKCVASYIPIENKIIIEEKALEVIRSFGSDSLNAYAFILGHELVHFLQKQVEGDHTSNFLSYDVGVDFSRRAEKQADIQGALMTYLAGYKTTHLIGSLLEKLYTAYDLPTSSIYGYPTLDERKFSGKEAMAKAEELIHLMEAAEYMSIIGYYDQAAAAYQYISKFYPGPEIYHNLGVQYLQEALNISDQNIDRFIYPIELDPQSRLKKPFKSGGSKSLDIMERVRRAGLLEKAKMAFENAQKNDSQRSIHYLHILITYCLFDQPEMALKYFQDLPASILTQKETAWQFEWMFGIIQALLGNEEKAKGIFSIISKEAPADYTRIAIINGHLVDLKASAPLLKDYHCPFKPSKEIELLTKEKIPASTSLEDNKNTLFGYMAKTNSTTLRIGSIDNLVNFYEAIPKKSTIHPNSLPVMKKGNVAFYSSREDQMIYLFDTTTSVLTEIQYTK